MQKDINKSPTGSQVSRNDVKKYVNESALLSNILWNG